MTDDRSQTTEDARFVVPLCGTALATKREPVVNVRGDAVTNFSLRLSPNAAKREDWSGAAIIRI
jgi:hypothetical protein